MTEKTKSDLVYHGLLGMHCRPMTEQETMVFVAISFACMNGKEAHILESLDPKKELRDSALYKIMKNRLEINGGSAKENVLFFVSCLHGVNNPAIAVVWAYTLYKIWEKTGKEVDMDAFTVAFHSGIPKTNDYESAWEEQKLSNFELDTPPRFTDNLLDAVPWKDIKAYE